MKLHIRHVTHYKFDTPVKRLIQSHRLTPADHEGQKVLEWSVSCEGAIRGSSFLSGAGDYTETVCVQGPAEDIEIIVEGTVETQDCAGVLRGHREKVLPSAYLRPTQQTQPDAAIRSLAETAIEGLDVSAGLDRAHALAAAVNDAIEYVSGETEPATTAAEALAGGKGVCQDHTHVLMSAARWVDMPARYVTGYLYSDANGQAHGESHAWAELYVDGLGWVGFDAANRCCPNDLYVRLGSGLDAQDAAPIRGLIEGQATEDLTAKVVVTDVAQQQ